MNRDAAVTVRRTVLIVWAAALLASGAAAAYFIVGRDDPRSTDTDRAGMIAPPSAASPAAAPAARARPDAPLPDVVVTLTEEAVERAGITVSPVGSGEATAGLRLPGIVQPNAYRQVDVTPLVAGRITRVNVELGEQVRRGQTLAQVFSPELAEAQARYTSARAELAAHDRELERTQKLVEIGAASRQELERIHAVHAAQTAVAQSARSRLELLGVSAASLDAVSGTSRVAIASVPSPIAGAVTERLANVGLNVDPNSKLFTVVDLSDVWVMADLYEQDFSQVRVGSSATVTTAAYPDLKLQGRVSYIDPQVRADTRTAKLRVEVQNPGAQLRFGMYADVRVASEGGAAAALIPRSAVQSVGDRQVVYLVNRNEPATFTEREVHLGPMDKDHVEVISGVQPGDVIVTAGSFFLRAERERLGLRRQAGPAPPVAGKATESHTARGEDVQTARITVGEQGFEPSRLTLRPGIPARIMFVRTSDKTCATEVAFPSLEMKRTLPLNQPVVVEFTPSKGELIFACGMNMFRGAIVVK